MMRTLKSKDLPWEYAPYWATGARLDYHDRGLYWIGKAQERCSLTMSGMVKSSPGEMRHLFGYLPAGYECDIQTESEYKKP